MCYQLLPLTSQVTINAHNARQAILLPSVLEAQNLRNVAAANWIRTRDL